MQQIGRRNWKLRTPALLIKESSRSRICPRSERQLRQSSPLRNLDGFDSQPFALREMKPKCVPGWLGICSWDLRRLARLRVVRNGSQWEVAWQLLRKQSATAVIQ